MAHTGPALRSPGERWHLPYASSRPAVRSWPSSRSRSTSGSSLVDCGEDVGGADVGGRLPAGLLYGLRHSGSGSLALNQAAEVSLQRLAGLSRANLHRVYGIIGHVSDGECGHECILSSLTA